MTVLRTARLGVSKHYEVAWKLENLGTGRLDIEESWLPHGAFRAARRGYAPPVELSVGSPIVLTHEVALAAEAGARVENTFVILRVRYQEIAWRIFVRMQIAVDPDWSIRPIVETVTASPVAPEA